ncbi:SMI1/KNR4 family protein [Mesorhizobium amorphae]
MKSLIAEAKRVYEQAGLDCGHGLLPPAEPAAVERISSDLSLRVPDELRAVFATHGGQDYIPPGITGLFGEHRLHSPAEVVEYHTTYVDNYLAAFDSIPAFPPSTDDPGRWVPDLIPFASWDAYSLCIHATREDVWEFLPSSGLIRHRPSIASVLEEIIESVRAGNEAQLGAMR